MLILITLQFIVLALPGIRYTQIHAGGSKEKRET